MSSIGNYKQAPFSETQKFLVLDPSSGSTSLVAGSSLVDYITPRLDSVKAESTRLSAENTDYAVGTIIQTSGASTPGDDFAAVYLVVGAGEGDFPMLNGNELLTIRGDEFLREQLISEDPGEGASRVSMEGGPTVEVAVNNRVIRVSSRTDMKGYDVPAGYQFSLGEGGRSGTFEVLSGDYTAEVAADTLEGAFVAFDSDPTGSAKVAKRIGGDSLDPVHFGADDTGATDSTAEIQACFDMAAFLGAREVRTKGTFLISDTIAIDSVQCNWLTSCRFNVDSSFTADADVITISNSAEFSHTGKIRIQGTGGSDYSLRKARHGIVIKDNSCKGQCFGSIEAFFIKGYGFRVEGSAASPMIGVTKVKAWDCGATPAGTLQEYDFTYTWVSNEGSTGSANARSTLDVSVDTATLEVGEALYILGRLYSIHSIISSSQLKVTGIVAYSGGDPEASGTASYVAGGGVYITGSDNSKYNIGMIDALACGHALRDKSLYPATVQNIVTQFCGAGISISDIGDAAIGGAVLSSYFENNTFDVVQWTVSSSFRYFIRASVTLNVDKIFTMYYYSVTTAELKYNNRSYFVIESGVETIRNGVPLYEVITASTNIDISENDNVTELFYGPNGYARKYTLLAVGTVTLTVPAGYTINGGTTSDTVTSDGFTQVVVTRSVGLGGPSTDYVTVTEA